MSPWGQGWKDRAEPLSCGQFGPESTYFLPPLWLPHNAAVTCRAEFLGMEPPCGWERQEVHLTAVYCGVLQMKLALGVRD